MNVDELIDQRQQARAAKDYALCDRLRNILDEELVFVFDEKDGTQTVYYLTEKYFRRKKPEMSHRKYLEYRIKEDIKAENMLNGWLYTVRNSKR